MRPAFQHGIHEGFDEIVVILAAHPLVPPSDIDRVGETLLVVGPDIEQDRQGGGRMETGAGGIERQFADRDAHAVGALVSETEDALAIADDNSFHVVEAGVRQDFLDTVALRPAQKQTTRIMPVMAEGLASLADRRGVDEREHFFEVLGQHRVKERLVRILQSSQEDIAVEIAGELPHCLETPRRLHFQGSDMRRQEAVQREGSSLFVGKGGPFVQHRVGEQRRPFELGLDEIRLRGRAVIGHAMPPAQRLRSVRASSITSSSRRGGAGVPDCRTDITRQGEVETPPWWRRTASPDNSR